jgi:hypothetical protein
MSDAPERIWASPEHADENGYGGFWIAAKVAPSVEYLRADLAARREADAYRAGLEAAAKWHDDQATAWEWFESPATTRRAREHRDFAAAIRAMKDDTP